MLGHKSPFSADPHITLDSGLLHTSTNQDR
jgi:hypothetical protein